jgi:hypothetical protein
VGPFRPRVLHQLTVPDLLWALELGGAGVEVVVPDVPAAVAELTDGFGGSPPEPAGLSPLTAAVAAAARGVVHRHAAGVEGQCAALAEKFGEAAAAALDP